jgi:hypothetical protein
LYLSQYNKNNIWHLITSMFVCLMVFNATFNNISVISWRSVLLVEETGVSGENHWPVASRSYGSWIYNYLCNQNLSPLMLWVRVTIGARCTTLYGKVCQWLAILPSQWKYICTCPICKIITIFHLLSTSIIILVVK